MAIRGEHMAAEMAEQPDRLSRLLDRSEEIGRLVRDVAPDALNGIAMVARGSSDNAAIYGRYVLEAATGKPVSLTAPSLHTLYRIEADYRGQLAIAISQSGATPEIATTLQALQRAGARGLAITNDPHSALASAADATLDLAIGQELAVPATKTVTGQLLAFAIIARALGRAPFTEPELDAVPASVQTVLDDPAAAAGVADSLVGAPQLIVVARGYLFAAALETALKIKETCSLLVDGYSAADLRHGPIAAVTAGLPVVSFSVPGPAAVDLASLATELRERGATVLTFSDDGLPEPLAPIVAVVRGQQLAYQLAIRLGFDPDSPGGLTKVTAT